MRKVMADHRSGDRLGNYRLLLHCGTGAYGSVFLARDVVSGRECALKILSEQTDFRERERNGLRQYQAICRQSSLMQIYHIGEADGVFYYTMDAADNLSADSGQYEADTLQNRLKKYGRIKSSELLDIALQLEQCLDTLHKKGVLHRDIKPANILFVNGRAMPGDIGLVTEKEGASLAGTAAFVSPQTAAGLRSFCREDDFYALGKTVYCALTGNPPEKYPSFPEDLDLTECKKVIALYNRWIRGSENTPSRRKKYWYSVILIAVFFSTIAVGRFLSLDRSAVPEPVVDIHAYKDKTVPYCALLVPDEKLQKILPVLRQEKKRLSIDRMQAGTTAFQKAISKEELAEAEKNPDWVSDPESFLRIRRKDDAIAAFDREHQNDPVLQYFAALDWLNEELRRITALAQIPGIENTDFSADWAEFQKRFSEFEKIKRVLLKKYAVY